MDVCRYAAHKAYGNFSMQKWYDENKHLVPSSDEWYAEHKNYHNFSMHEWYAKNKHLVPSSDEW